MNRGWDPIFPARGGNDPLDGPLSALDGAVELEPISD